MRSSKIMRLVPVFLLGFVLSGYVIYPLLATLWQSVSIAGEFSLKNYVDILSPANRANIEAVRNSVAVSALSVLFGGMVGMLFAFVCTQIEFPLRTLVSRLAIIPIALPPLVGVISFLFVFGESGMLPRLLQELFGTRAVPFSLDGMSAIIAVHTYSFYVYFYLFVSTALRELDGSTVEAALALGSSPWRTFRRVVFPELRPALAGASILTFMASMASFSAPLLFAGDKRFMTIQIYNAKLNGELDVASAQAIGLTALSIIFFVVLRLTSRTVASARRTKGTARTRLLVVSPAAKRVLILTVLVLLVLELLPILTILLISLAREGSWTWQVMPTAYTLDNYVHLIGESNVFEPIQNSLLMMVVAVAASVLVGVSAAYLVTKGGLRKSAFGVDMLATISFAIPGTVIAIGLIIAFNSPNIFSVYSVLVGTFWILPLAYFIRMFPLVVRSTAASFERLDDSLLEAAETFGAGSWRRFHRIALPIILPGIVSGGLLVAIAALGEFVSSVLLYSYSNRPISVEILAQMRTYNFGAAAAYSVFLLILILALTFLSNLILKRSYAATQDFNF